MKKQKSSKLWKLKPGDYEQIESVNEGILIKMNEKYGFINHSGEIMLHCVFDKIFLKDKYIEAIHDGRLSIYSYSGDNIVPGWGYVYVEPVVVCDQVLFKASHKEDNYFTLYSMGKQLLMPFYSSIDILSDGAIILCRDYKYYALARYDEEKDEVNPILPATFNSIYYMDVAYDKMAFTDLRGSPLVEVTHRGKSALFDTYGKQIKEFS